jgi:hypothetical protein
MHDRLIEAALGIAPPWFVAGVQRGGSARLNTILAEISGSAAV